MLDTKMANAIDSTASACAFTMYEREPDRLEQIRGIAIDPGHGERVEGALGRLLAHRADCGYRPPMTAPMRELLFLVGYRARMLARIGQPPERFLAQWCQAFL